MSLTLSGATSQVIVSTLILGTKFGVCQLFNIAYIANTYLFPIHLVATSYAICNISARVFTIFAPYVAELEPVEISEWIFSCMMLMSLIVSLFIQDPHRIKAVDSEKG